jgi:hypothetical protein
VPQDLTTLASPEFVLTAWAGGILFVSASVALSRMVGPGFTWLAGSVAGLIGFVGLFAGDPWWARFGMIVLALGLVWARNRQLSGIFQLTAALAFMFQAASVSAWIPAVTGTIALGGVTGEMMLGHWYLIDPKLPRLVLRMLAVAGGTGLVADSVVLAVAGMPSGGGAVAFWVLTATSVVLMGAVFAALRYPAYAGVMAATGLSYLAVLTTLGGVFLGRALVAGLGPFSN